MRELCRLFRDSTEQVGWSAKPRLTRVASNSIRPATITPDRANYSLQSVKTTILIDVNSLATKYVHFTTKKAWDGYIRIRVFRRSAEGLRVLSADAYYFLSDFREECRSNSRRSLIKHRE